MLLVHQTGSVKVGEVVRYTLTYTPSADRILPTPSSLHVRIKNTSAIPYRAAYLHGPYTVYVSTYRSTFNPYQKVDDAKRDGGIPKFEPNLKAGGQWNSELKVPEEIQAHGEKAQADHGEEDAPQSVTWFIEISSQILFSNTASVFFELLVGRDRRSLDFGFAATASKGFGEPGKVSDLIKHEPGAHGKHATPKGVYSKAIQLIGEDTAALWNKPPLPGWQPESKSHKKRRKSSVPDRPKSSSQDEENSGQEYKPNKIHLVVLTHGLHSNTGADLLYLKESIDATVKEAREESRSRRSAMNSSSREGSVAAKYSAQEDSDKRDPTSTAPLSGGQDQIQDNGTDVPDDEEEVIVRGFPGNATRTEKGIQYLGKRLARFILTFTYPDQPFLPPAKSVSRSFTSHIGSNAEARHRTSTASHKNSKPGDKLPYTFTSISFVGHSLGGLVQTYAIAYIHKHSPEFFSQIRPVNFITLAAPLLGLSNENPLYVKFALDFGLVGKTGQDLGLAWNSRNLAQSGWSAMMASFGDRGSAKQVKEDDPTTKPLLRILPSGPAHKVLKMFRNRTAYSNVVNDGIVPLRTSCLLFLDWRGLGRIEGARRDNGLLSTMAQFGWNEITGANTSSHQPAVVKSTGVNAMNDSEDEIGDSAKTTLQIEGSPTLSSKRSSSSTRRASPRPGQTASSLSPTGPGAVSKFSDTPEITKSATPSSAPNPFTEFFNFFRPTSPKGPTAKPPKPANKSQKAYMRAQTLGDQNFQGSDVSSSRSSMLHGSDDSRPSVARGESYVEDPTTVAPPKTSVFEAANDILNPPMPSLSWLIDPSSRTRTIFHDRIYRPEDIPPPQQKRARLTRSFSSDSNLKSTSQSSQGTGSIPSNNSTNNSGMKVEERIARAYHHDLSWRKVLVRLEPDAHNNIIVRRMFANAYGWDVVKHICDTHFANTLAASTEDDDEPTGERAKAANQPVTDQGDQVRGQTDRVKDGHTLPQNTRRNRTTSELREMSDEVKELRRPSPNPTENTRGRHSERPLPRQDSVVWSDDIFEDGPGDDTSDDEKQDNDQPPPGPFEAFQRFWSPSPVANQTRRQSGQIQDTQSQSEPQTPQSPHEQERGTSDKEIMAFLSHSSSLTDGHQPGPTSEEVVEGSGAQDFGSSKDSGESPTTVRHTSSGESPTTARHTSSSASSSPTKSKKTQRPPSSGMDTSELGLQKSIEEQVGMSPPGPSRGDQTNQDGHNDKMGSADAGTAEPPSPSSAKSRRSTSLMEQVVRLSVDDAQGQPLGEEAVVDESKQE
ncbi:MAG: hypothetical protein M1831_007532 [Alyxoria varia]|nr:MAG: hypothetical protein M1831_007532 [Alyxoria varia]